MVQPCFLMALSPAAAHLSKSQRAPGSRPPAPGSSLRTFLSASRALPTPPCPPWVPRPRVVFPWVSGGNGTRASRPRNGGWFLVLGNWKQTAGASGGSGGAVGLALGLCVSDAARGAGRPPAGVGAPSRLRVPTGRDQTRSAEFVGNGRRHKGEAERQEATGDLADAGDSVLEQDARDCKKVEALGGWRLSLKCSRPPAPCFWQM